MKKNSFNKLWESVLLENPYLPGPDGKGTEQGVSDFADPDTDPNDFYIKGINDNKSKIVSGFMRKIQSFAENLDTESLNQMTFGQIKKTVTEIHNEIEKVNTFAKAKIDQLNNDPAAIIAMTIATDAVKKSAFDTLFKTISNFNSQIEDLEGEFSTLKSKVDNFTKSETKTVESQPQ